MPWTRLLLTIAVCFLFANARADAQIRSSYRYSGHSYGGLGSTSGQSGIQPAPLRPNQTPAVSPYLYLTDGRFSTALSYYQRVRPQQRFQQQLESDYRDIQNLSREVTVLRQKEVDRQRGALQPTGHRAYYYNPGDYFQSTGSYYDRGRLHGQ